MNNCGQSIDYFQYPLIDKCLHLRFIKAFKYFASIGQGGIEAGCLFYKCRCGGILLITARKYVFPDKAGFGMRDNGTKFSGGKTAPGIKFSVGENGTAYPCAICQADKFFEPFACTKDGLTDGGCIDIIFYRGRYMKLLL